MNCKVLSNTLSMSEKIELKTYRSLMTKRALIGAGIALLLMALFLAGVDEYQPHWARLWFIRPLIIIQLAGAIGGAFHHIMDAEMPRKGWGRLLAIVISLIVYVLVLWFAGVLGLDGTLWD